MNQQAAHPTDTRQPPGLRLFFAVELPAEVRARVARHIEELRRVVTEARAAWERPEKLHVTLKFLGQVEEARVARLSAAAERAVRGAQAPELSIEGAGLFPPRGPVRVLWLGLKDETGALYGLQRRLEEECSTEGFAPEDRAFKPHITIARLRRPEGARRLAALHVAKGFAPAAFSVRRIVLMRSEPGPGGSRYTELSWHELKGE